MQAETVLITGASSGIGLELARCFAADKSHLVLVARNTKALQSLADELRRERGIQAMVLTADLSRPGTPARVFDELRRAGISVDVLVNNAGFGGQGAFARLPLGRQLEMIQVNVAALTELTGLFLPGMLERKRGGVLNVGSVAGFISGPGMAVYFATKAYVLSFSEALAAELAGTGLTVTALCPGPTATNFGNVARSPTERQFRAPKMSAETVARCGHHAFRKGRVLAVPGLQNHFLIFLTRIMPRGLQRNVVKSLNRTKD
ncbi:MAG TPA: SDR family oxidoreductase [Verrucomicrobiae bacterium]|nr:SDR family oxidoreductase [Verrucomicrobiae bacterium]